jgi:NAD+ synthase (glutamine-hydrolysing)
MRIALAQLNFHTGNFGDNLQKMLHAMEHARQERAEIIVFPELAICGYPPRDFLEFSDFIRQCNETAVQLAIACRDITAIVGCPTINPNIKGKNLLNSALVLREGEIIAARHKTLLPNYDIFDEYRYFEPNTAFEVVECCGKRIALTVCEDIWDIGEDPMYTVSPMDELMKQQPDLMINIAASPFHYEQAGLRREVMQYNARKYGIPLYYVNHVGAQTELLFDGGSLVVSAGGHICHEMAYFKEEVGVFESDHLTETNIHEQSGHRQELFARVGLVHDALVMGIRIYFEKLGFKRAILGLSGGIDSAVVLVLACEALGASNVRSVMLPSPFSTSHSVSDAVSLAENTGSPYDIIAINDIYDAVNNTLKPFFGDLPFDVTEENIQARIRALLLMALSNKYGYILLNTSNKSEAAVGYGTLYGDMCGGLSVLGDVYKTGVYELAQYINRDREVIPGSIITKPPSAELRHGQKDSDSLPEYEILDKILYQYIEQRQGPRELIAMGFGEGLVRRVLKLVNTSEYKRHQTPPILRISAKAFGMGRRLPIVAKYLS